MPTGTRAHLPDRTVISPAPGQLPRPPGRPPAEPIVIRIPPRPHDDLEIEMPEREDDEWRRDQAAAALGSRPAATSASGAADG